MVTWRQTVRLFSRCFLILTVVFDLWVNHVPAQAAQPVSSGQDIRQCQVYSYLYLHFIIMQRRELTLGSPAEVGHDRRDERPLDSGRSTAALLQSDTQHKSPHSPSLRCPAQTGCSRVPFEVKGLRSAVALDYVQHGTPLPGQSVEAVGHRS